MCSYPMAVETLLPKTAVESSSWGNCYYSRFRQARPQIAKVAQIRCNSKCSTPWTIAIILFVLTQPVKKSKQTAKNLRKQNRNFKNIFLKMEEDFNSIFDEHQETNDETNICMKRNRVILHFDIDCFYAQVEMIKDPSLASKPLGIQQKNIVVTCNYIAREKGVGKCTWIPDAKKACPELVLVNGEDLADYRRWSQQIFDLIYRNTG